MTKKLSESKKQFYKRLYDVLKTQADENTAVYGILSRTTLEVTMRYNEKYRENLNTKQIAAALSFLHRRRHVSCTKEKNKPAEWWPTRNAIYDLL